MLDKLKLLLEFFSKNGAYLPGAYDADKKGPSVTLLFAYIAYITAIVTIISLSIKDINSGVIAAMIFSSLQTVFYLFRRLTKAKFDLDDKSVELENEEKDEKSK